MTLRPHILIVDDEAGIRESLTLILRDEGYQVDAVGSAEEALERSAVGDLEVVLLDVWLPGIDGLEALSRIQALPHPPAVIMISGHGTIETAVRATKLGAKFSGSNGRFDGSMAGNHDDCRRVRQRLNAAKSFEAVDPRKPDVEKHNLQIAHRGTFQGFLGRPHRIHLIAFIPQDESEGLANASLVVDDEDVWPQRHRAVGDPLWSATEAAGNSAAGNSITKREPTGKLSSTWMLPPCSAMMRAAMASPRPVPRSLVE